MKTTHILRGIIALFVAIAFSSCSSNDDNATLNDLEGLVKIQEIANESHTIELYSATGTLQQGYNSVSLRIKDNATGEYQTNATIDWKPLMHMTMMSHSCPKSPVMAAPGKPTIYNGYMIFQMAQNDSEYWDLTINYTIDAENYSASSQIDVPASPKQRVTTFTGTDGAYYIVALVAPDDPKVALNDMTAAVYRMDSMTSFSPVSGFTVKIDPRMPGMGNHGSPNNVDLVQNGTDELYHGKLSLTMTGYWRINLQLLDEAGEVLKGEAITPEVPQSTIYFETEF